MPYNAVIVPRHVIVVRLALFIRALLWHRSHVRFGIAPMSTDTPPGRGRPFAAALRMDVALLLLLRRRTKCCGESLRRARRRVCRLRPRRIHTPVGIRHCQTTRHTCTHQHGRAVPSTQAHARPPARTRTHALAPAQTRYCASVLKAKQCMRKLWKIRTIRSATSAAQLSSAARGCAIAAGPVGRRFARPRVGDVLCRQERERHSRDGGACIANPPCTRAGTLAHIEALMRYGGWLPAWRLEGKNGCIKNGCIGGNGCSARHQTNSCSTAAHPRLCARRGRGALHCTVGL
jgi:hypothetical protein